MSCVGRVRLDLVVIVSPDATEAEVEYTAEYLETRIQMESGVSFFGDFTPDTDLW